MNNYTYHMRAFIEKDSSWASFAPKLRNFASRPFSSSLKGLFGQRMPAKEWLSKKTLKSATGQFASGADTALGFGAAGIVASPFFVGREV